MTVFAEFQRRFLLIADGFAVWTAGMETANWKGDGPGLGTSP